MLKAKVSLVMLIILSGLFIVGLTKLGTNKTEAAEIGITGFGNTCINNLANCVKTTGDPNSVVINQLFSDSNVKGSDFSSSDLKNAIDKEYPLDAASNACISSTIFNNQVIPYWQDNPPSNFLPIGPVRTGTQLTAHACLSGYTAQSDQAKANAGGSDYTSWGCCPTYANYQFITISGRTAADTQTHSACCLIPNGAKPGDTNYPTEIAVDLGGSESTDDCRGPSVGGNYGPSIWQTNTFGTKSDGAPINTMIFTSSNSDILGSPLDSHYLQDGAYIQSAPKIGAAKVCDLPVDSSGKQSGCGVVIDDGSGQIAVNGSNVTSDGVTYRIIDANSLTDGSGPNLQCQKCYTDGDPILIENLDPNSSKEPELILCDLKSTSGPLIKRTALINNSVADTLAVIRAQDTTNGDFIQQCRAGGGIPTAIGCIDPSPLGIITGLIRIALGVVGGIALIELIIVGVQYQRGDEEEIKKARERLIATLTGVAVLIFSVLILRILGVNILDLIPAGSV